MLRAVRGLALAVSMCFTFTAWASRVEFVAPAYHPTPSVAWPAFQGFEFVASQWDWNGGRDTRNAPLSTVNAAAIVSTFGAYTFNSIEVGAWPWDNVNIFSGIPSSIAVNFYDASGGLIALRTLDLVVGNQFEKLTETIEGVRAISIGGNGVRLGAITFNEVASPVPEPSTAALFLAALIILWSLGTPLHRVVAREPKSATPADLTEAK